MNPESENIMSNREIASKTFADNLRTGEYDKELESILLAWQIENANTRIKDFLDHLNGKYDGHTLSVAPLNQSHVDELLNLGRELFAETRRAYLKANIQQYVHDLEYIKEPTIYITETEWNQIHAGEVLSLDVCREFATKKIDELEDGLNRIETALESTEAPVKRGRKAKTDSE